jgi:hypothetical protein
MTVMIIGGDHLGNISDQLKERGFNRIKHVTGRKNGAVTEMISGKLDLVLVLTDYVGTNLSKVVKDEAKKHDLPVVFARRSWSCIAKEMERVCCSCCQQPCSKRPDSVARARDGDSCCGGVCQCHTARKTN